MTTFPNEPILRTVGLSKRFDQEEILSKVDLLLYESEIVSLLGISGSGKSTLFNLISGLIQPDEGKIYLRGEDITGQSGHCSYMLQKDLLLKHMTVLDNVCLPLLIKGVPKAEARRQALTHFPAFGLSGNEDKYPHQISGGMAQRAAFLRTYLMGFDVALLDEPFSALDAITKTQIHDWYLNIMKELKLSTLFITHDVDEAIKLSDRIYVLEASPGRIKAELSIAPELCRSKDFHLRPEFLDYKKEILALL